MTKQKQYAVGSYLQPPAASVFGRSRASEQQKGQLDALHCSHRGGKTKKRETRDLFPHTYANKNGKTIHAEEPESGALV